MDSFLLPYFTPKPKNQHTHIQQALHIRQISCVTAGQYDMPPSKVSLQSSFLNQMSVRPVIGMLSKAYIYHTTRTVVVANNLESNCGN